MGQSTSPPLCITVQGAKEVSFGDQLFSYGEMGFLLVTIEMPAFGGITTASTERPYIGITIDLDLGEIRDVMDQLDQPPVPSNDQGIGVFACPLEGALADGVVRLARLLGHTTAIPILRSAVMREICFWLLNGQHGQACSTQQSHATHSRSNLST